MLILGLGQWNADSPLCTERSRPPDQAVWFKTPPARSARAGIAQGGIAQAAASRECPPFRIIPAVIAISADRIASPRQRPGDVREVPHRQTRPAGRRDDRHQRGAGQ